MCIHFLCVFFSSQNLLLKNANLSELPKDLVFNFLFISLKVYEIYVHKKEFSCSLKLELSLLTAQIFIFLGKYVFLLFPPRYSSF